MNKFLALIIFTLTLQSVEAKTINGHSLSATTILLDRNATGEYVYNDILSAIDALNAMPSDVEKTLFIAPGVYWLDDPDDETICRANGADWGVPFAATLKASHVHIIGLDGNAENVVIAANRGQTQGAVGNYTMLHVKGSDVTAENVTFGNYCNVDLHFPLDTLQNRQRRANAIVQAQIAICDRNSDRFYFKNCRFISRLNLCPFVGAWRTYYENCHFECTDDALNGLAVYRNCHFTFFSSKPFYNTNRNGGAVLLNCTIDSHVEGTQYFTKAGGPLTLVDVRINGPKISNIAWSRGNEPYVGYTYNVTLNGEPIKIDNALRTVDMAEDKALLHRYKYDDDTYNVAGLLAGDDGWNPTNATKVHSYATTLLVEPNKLTAEAQGDIVDLNIRVVRWGGVEIYPAHTQRCSTHNSESHEVVICDTVNSYGLRGIYKYRVKGYYEAAPKFSAAPQIAIGEDGRVVCTYALTKKTSEEEKCEVSWYRLLPNGASVCVCRHTNVSCGRDTFSPSAADANHRIYAMVTPQLSNSYAGEPQRSNVVELGKNYEAPLTLETDFSDICLALPISDTISGVWLLDAFKPLDTYDYAWLPNTQEVPWCYDIGCAENTYGLTTKSRGARMRYWFPTKVKGLDMTLDLFVCKPAGQGFGSATGQYLDIALWHDRNSRLGYSLRIERTPEYDRAVVMTIMHHQGDRVAPISKPVVTRLFKNSCRISISMKGAHFVASIQNLTEASDAVDSIETTIAPMAIYGLSLQHTGSVGANGLTLNSLKITRD
ncbi:MAG: hypothetical protein J6Y72_07150 [Bacteroidales bacterium]|nr:hypothetical protein [Bacteroidales bacterium]